MTLSITAIATMPLTLGKQHADQPNQHPFQQFAVNKFPGAFQPDTIIQNPTEVPFTYNPPFNEALVSLINEETPGALQNSAPPKASSSVGVVRHHQKPLSDSSSINRDPNDALNNLMLDIATNRMPGAFFNGPDSNSNQPNSRVAMITATNAQFKLLSIAKQLVKPVQQPTTF